VELKTTTLLTINEGGGGRRGAVGCTSDS